MTSDIVERVGWTPGPWSIGYDDQSGPEYIVGQGQKAIATLRWGCSCCKSTPDTFLDMTPEERANSRLIAAAPDLYEALQVLAEIPIEQFDKLSLRKDDHLLMGWNDHTLTVGHVRKARAALSKATGATP